MEGSKLRRPTFFRGLLGPNGHRYLLFASDRILGWLRSFDSEDYTIMADGTFYSKPKKSKCAQLYRVIAVYQGQVSGDQPNFELILYDIK